MSVRVVCKWINLIMFIIATSWLSENHCVCGHVYAIMNLVTIHVADQLGIP